VHRSSSTPPPTAVQGAPNVVTVVLDDTGFGQLGCYGSPIATPNFDAIAADGLRKSNMHTTALCSPSRSCIVAGRNHRANGMAAITELASGFPGYVALPRWRTGSCRRSCWRTVTTPTRSASGTSHRAMRRPRSPRLTGGHWAGGRGAVLALVVPDGPPSALAPLSGMTMIRVLSSLPRVRRKSSNRPRW